MGLRIMSTEQERVRDSLLKSREELTQSVYDVINAWMLTSDAKLDPDFALGLVIGALAQAGGDYSAAHRLLYAYGPDWSNTYIAATSKMFANAHCQNFAILSQAIANNTDESFKN
jgi:hypothetical protein